MLYWQEKSLFRLILGLFIFLVFLSFSGQKWILNLPLPWICPFKTLTGYPCPGCGLTEATRLLLQGEIKQAFFVNPLVFLVWGLLIFVAIFPEKALVAFQKKRGWELLLVLVLGWWAFRLIFGL
ncbi:DUF2752 domain-containing protein [Thermodesulfatator autotrophicus]|uniref:DUF2752 domain-containing protein n=1 Tax=Thermodesulfatator autotrophicus TaxID=1795632 RepID=A0A177E8T5_9BACT|nr:DUF2752 domain-containing protein [Thermodesulfatator autotrophicus]OAG28116.1 hypothetical protein TH606_03530 [Thermodesulfatator autotrophicus]